MQLHSVRHLVLFKFIDKSLHKQVVTCDLSAPNKQSFCEASTNTDIVFQAKTTLKCLLDVLILVFFYETTYEITLFCSQV